MRVVIVSMLRFRRHTVMLMAVLMILFLAKMYIHRGTTSTVDVINAKYRILDEIRVGPEDRRLPLRVYPAGGTGIPVNMSGHFDANVFNSFCDTEVPLKAVLPVYSSTDRFEIRNILRSTLGKWAKKLNCKLFFISGVSLNATVNSMIKDEYVREKDILMMSKVDAYIQLNDKAVLMVDWLSHYCRHVPYVVHLIDDAFINLELFLQRLDSLDGSDYILGGYMSIPAPRNTSLKTFVTKEEYPDKIFPDYAIGFAYAFRTSTSERLLSVVHTAKYCWIEDVWFTGHVREAANVRLIGLKRSEWKADEDKPVPNLLDGLPPYFMVHSLDPKLFYQLYSTVSNSTF